MRRLVTVHGVQSLGHLGVVVLGKELSNRRRVELASGHPEPFGEDVGRLKEVVRQGDGCFHTDSIPRSYQRRMRT